MEKLFEAHKALDDYANGKDFDHEHVCRLVKEISTAREELIRLLSDFTAHGKT